MEVCMQWFLTALLFLVPAALAVSYKVPVSLLVVYFSLLVLVSLILPLIFHFSLSLQRGVLYFYFVDRPEEGVLSQPEIFSLENARNFYIQNNDVTLGVWQLLPETYRNSSGADFAAAISDGAPVVLYIHGNIGSRATDHRIQLYQTLQRIGYHVITFDYRCFGDSTYSTPHEAAVVSDCLAVARWLFRTCPNAPIFFWGHSLGTGMTTRMAATLSAEGLDTHGVILQSPFDNMPSEIRVHPFGTVFRVFPWYNLMFSEPYFTNGEDFYSSRYILQFAAPILILHADDDPVIPSQLGLKLYRHGVEKRSVGSGPMEIKVFESSRGYGHAGLCKAPEIPSLVREFVSKFKDDIFKPKGKTHLQKPRDLNAISSLCHLHLLASNRLHHRSSAINS